jgi:hypothetical protein
MKLVTQMAAGAVAAIGLALVMSTGASASSGDCDHGQQSYKHSDRGSYEHKDYGRGGSYKMHKASYHSSGTWHKGKWCNYSQMGYWCHGKWVQYSQNWSQHDWQQWQYQN